MFADGVHSESGENVMGARTVVCIAAVLSSACGSSYGVPATSDGRGTITSGIKVISGNSEIIRSTGDDREVNEDELFLAQGNRAAFYIVVRNSSNGWVPVNFELCVDHTDVLAVLDASQRADDADFLDGPCEVRYDDGEWWRLEQGDKVGLHAGSILALDRPGGGYVTIYIRADFPETGVLDLWEYTFPYRVLP